MWLELKQWCYYRCKLPCFTLLYLEVLFFYIAWRRIFVNSECCERITRREEISFTIHHTLLQVFPESCRHCHQRYVWLVRGWWSHGLYNIEVNFMSPTLPSIIVHCHLSFVKYWTFWISSLKKNNHSDSALNLVCNNCWRLGGRGKQIVKFIKQNSS